MTPVALSSPLLSTDTTAKPKNAAEAAEQFESLLLAQMLRTAREDSGDSLSEDQDPSAGSLWDLSVQQFSQMLAKNGGVGLAKMIAPRLG